MHRCAGLLPLLLFVLLRLHPAPALADPGRPGGEESPARFARIVSLAPRLSESLYLLGRGDSLVGNTLYCRRPEAARTKEKVGTILELGIEKIVSLKPELVLATNLNPPQQVDKLVHLGLRVESFPQPRSFDDLCAQFLRLGELLGREPQARAIVSEARARVEAIRRVVAPLPRPTVLLQIGADPLFSSLPGSFTHAYIELAGGSNIADEQVSGMMQVEQVLARDPEVILIAVVGGENGVGAREKQRWLNYGGLAAARTGRVAVLDPDPVCSPSPLTFAETLAAIARLLHPEAELPDQPEQNGGSLKPGPDSGR